MFTYLLSGIHHHVTKEEEGELTWTSRSPCLRTLIVQELCESRGGRPGLSVLTSLLVSVDVKLY